MTIAEHSINNTPLRRVFSSILIFASLLAILPLASCDSLIYDEEGDCDPYYRVRFEFTRHLKYGDAFPYEVGEVTLYLIDDETSEVVLEIHDDSPALSLPGYTMEIGREAVVPGKSYSMVAWCGEGHRNPFTVNETAGPRKEHLRCRLTAAEVDPADGNSHYRDLTGNLYHGKREAVTFPEDQGVHLFTIPLTKDTNDFHIVLQHMSGKPVDPEMFDFAIVADNAHMDWDNTLIPGSRVAYHHWYKEPIVAGIENDDNTITFPEESRGRAVIQTSATVADLRTARLIKGSDARVTITRKDGKQILSLPIVDYCLSMKGQYRGMEDQEFLDRKDDYSFVFLLDENYEWMKSYIYVESWKVKTQYVDL